MNETMGESAASFPVGSLPSAQVFGTKFSYFCLRLSPNSSQTEGRDTKIKEINLLESI